MEDGSLLSKALQLSWETNTYLGNDESPKQEREKIRIGLGQTVRETPARRSLELWVKTEGGECISEEGPEDKKG